MKALTPAEIVDVADGLLKGFNQEWQLERLIATAADINLALDIGRGHPLRKTAGDIINLTEVQGATELVLREAAFQRPTTSSSRRSRRVLPLRPRRCRTCA